MSEKQFTVLAPLRDPVDHPQKRTTERKDNPLSIDYLPKAKDQRREKQSTLNRSAVLYRQKAGMKKMQSDSGSSSAEGKQ